MKGMPTAISVMAFFLPTKRSSRVTVPSTSSMLWTAKRGGSPPSGPATRRSTMSLKSNRLGASRVMWARRACRRSDRTIGARRQIERALSCPCSSPSVSSGGDSAGAPATVRSRSSSRSVNGLKRISPTRIGRPISRAAAVSMPQRTAAGTPSHSATTIARKTAATDVAPMIHLRRAVLIRGLLRGRRKPRSAPDLRRALADGRPCRPYTPIQSSSWAGASITWLPPQDATSASAPRYP